MNEHVAEAITVFFVGAIILMPVAALSARFALKPILALLSRRVAADEVVAQVAQQGRRIELLESELAAMNESMKRLAVATEFQRELAGPRRE